MTLSWSQVSTNRGHVFYYGFSLTIYNLLIDCKLKFHFFQQQLFLVCWASSSNVTWSSCKLSINRSPWPEASNKSHPHEVSQMCSTPFRTGSQTLHVASKIRHSTKRFLQLCLIVGVPRTPVTCKPVNCWNFNFLKLNSCNFQNVSKTCNDTFTRNSDERKTDFLSKIGDSTAVEGL